VKRTTGILLVGLVLLAGCSKKAEPTTNPVPAPPPAQQAEATPKPPEPKAPEPISGPIYLLDKPASTLWPGPATVVVENSPQARPQSGLMDAHMVVESLTESEITRFLAFFWEADVKKIGPVRSARNFSVRMAHAYHAPFLHAGGNMDALAMLRGEFGGAANIDDIFTYGPAFYRSSDRVPPHNLYTTTANITQAISDRGIPMSAVPTTPRAEPVAAPEKPVSKVLVDWHKWHKLAWEWTGKAYQRLEDGTTPHTVDDGTVITAPNLVFLWVQGEYMGGEDGWVMYMDQGGKARVIAGGNQWEGTWALGPGGFALQPAEGKALPLVPGNVWVHLITPGSEVEVTAGN